MADELNPELTPEQMAGLSSSRTKSDAHLIEEGAEYIYTEDENGRLQLTNNQVEIAKQEMASTLSLKNIEQEKRKVRKPVKIVEETERKQPIEYYIKYDKQGRIVRKYDPIKTSWEDGKREFRHEVTIVYNDAENTSIKYENKYGLPNFQSSTSNFDSQGRTVTYLSRTMQYCKLSFTEDDFMSYEYTEDDQGRTIRRKGTGTSLYANITTDTEYEYLSKEGSLIITERETKMVQGTMGPVAGTSREMVIERYRKYDPSGRLIIEGEKIDTTATATTYNYDEHGEVIRKVVITQDPNGNKTKTVTIFNITYDDIEIAAIQNKQV